MAGTPTERELALRARLGVPADAARVLVFAESSHWDPNWFLTSDQYFRFFVGKNLDLALDELEREPRRVYSVECVFFLRMYWERRPARRDELVRLVNEGRIRLTSSGVTTADTIIPDEEAILRDFLVGQEWLRAHGMTQEPRAAYFPDSFGHSPALPSLLRAAGFTMAAVTRIDGMFFPGSDYEPQRNFPRPGSSAQRLLETDRSIDFVWRGPDGAEVLAHWNAFTYGHGDLLTHRGIIRVYNVPFGLPRRSDRAVAKRIDQYAAALEPVSRTPYLFVPIGFDFNRPLRGLVGYLDRYNQARYPVTGTWAVNAALDDYLDLVGCRRETLPVLSLDPNPYWTGFYSARPTLKKKARDTVELLLLADRARLLPGAAGNGKAGALLDEAWWHAATANHHDFITGTATDRVVRAEQGPSLDRAAAAAEEAIVLMRAPAECRDAAVPLPLRAPVWRSRGGRVEVRTSRYLVELAEEAGGGIVRAADVLTNAPLLAGVSNDLVSYRDAGGLWRMGHEFFGGHLTETVRASQRRALMQVVEGSGFVEVTAEVEMDGERLLRVARFVESSPVIRFRVEGRAPRGRSITARFETGIHASRLVMDAPGGVVTRPPVRQYDPTFWPGQRFIQIVDDRACPEGGGRAAVCGEFAALYLGMPGAVAYRAGGALEAIALRNAVHERFFDLLPIPAMPVPGYDHARHVFEYAISFDPAGDRAGAGDPRCHRRIHDSLAEPAGRAALRALVEDMAAVDNTEVSVSALKPAARGAGIIARLSTGRSAGAEVTLTLKGVAAGSATLCDARERDIEPLEVRDGAVRLRMPGNIATVRIIPA